jgi:DNA-binding ferritin-like protein
MKGAAMRPITPACLAAAALLACAPERPAENVAETLEEAAEQSTPEAADVLENHAERIREEGAVPPGAVENALNEAAEAQVGNRQQP